MGKKPTSSGLFTELRIFFISIKLTVFILITLAATSIIGTLIPQNKSDESYIHAYGNFLYRIFKAINIFDMYHSWWFQFLIILLAVNIIVCSIDRLASIWKIIFIKIPVFKISRFHKLKDKEAFSSKRSPDALINIYEKLIARRFAYHTVEKTDNGFCIFAEKGRWTRLGVYIVHSSIVLLLAGSLIGSFLGFEGYVNIPEGSAKNVIFLRNTMVPHELDFSIQCDDFNVSFYETGAPKEFRSSLTLIENGTPVRKKDIIVNDPLRYKGINIFQSNYGADTPKEIVLAIFSNSSSMEYKKTVRIGEKIDLPEGLGELVINNFMNNYKFKGHAIGQSFFGSITSDKGETQNIVLPVQYPQFDKMRRGNAYVSVADFKHSYYTGLQVTKDPGVPVVYTGFILMILGCFVTFFMSHQSICVEVMKKGKTSSVLVSGIANKNKPGMRIKVKKILQQLEKTG